MKCFCEIIRRVSNDQVNALWRQKRADPKHVSENRFVNYMTKRGLILRNGDTTVKIHFSFA